MNDKEKIKDIISEYTCDCQKMNGSSDCYGCVHSDEYGKKCYLENHIAQALSNAGYGDVEKCKEENDKLKQVLENEFTFKTTTGGKYNILDSVRKVAIKEFAEKLKNKLITRDYVGQIHNGRYLNTIEVDELLKE